MKKIVFLFVLILLLSSCSLNDNKEVSLNKESLNCAFVLHLKDTVYSGEMFYDEKECLHFVMSRPTEISGTELISLNGKISLVYKNSVIECSDIVVKPVISEISGAIDKLTVKNELSYKEGLYRYSDDETNAVLDEGGNLKSISQKDFEFYLS